MQYLRSLPLLIFLFTSSAFAVCEQHQKCENKFYVKDNFLTYYSSHNLSQADLKIERLVVVIHGALRNGHEYFDDTVAAAQKHAVETKTIVVAPTFRKVTDERMARELYWGRKWYQKWKYGYLSEDTDKVSSFTVIDSLIKEIINSNKFSKLKNIVITGHSAGGQFSQRYAVGSKLREEIKQTITFVPSNPSSYMYLDKQRYHFSDGNFQLRAAPANCIEYNHYIYGPIDRARYLAKYSVEELRENFKSNQVTFLMSEEDKGTDRLDRSCEAMLQGKNRFERAKNYFYYDKKYIGSHQFVGIPAIGHEHTQVYASKEAGQVVFGLKKKIDPTYHYRKIGNADDVQGKVDDLFVLFGGGKNELTGFTRFLEAANGGDVLVISAKDELNHRYTHDFWNMAEEARIKIDSVETISFLSKAAGEKPFVIEKIKNAEAIFFTGGNQAKYINRIKDTAAHRELLNKVNMGTPIAGTSAGLAIMGEYIFSAKKGGFNSGYAMENPHSDDITIEHDFFYNPLFGNLITDTHFMNRAREGRLLTFMFRTQFDFNLKTLYGVGIDEHSSLAIDSKGMTAVGGVYFYKSNSSLVPRHQMGSLNYGPVKRLKIVGEHPHYMNLNFSKANSTQVVNGGLK